MIGLYDTLGVPRPTAVIVVLAYRLLSFWLPTLIGVALATYFEHSTATADEPVNHTEDSTTNVTFSGPVKRQSFHYPTETAEEMKRRNVAVTALS
jgi:hypothetical protein